jgi:hypothetical protein
MGAYFNTAIAPDAFVIIKMDFLRMAYCLSRTIFPALTAELAH